MSEAVLMDWSSRGQAPHAWRDRTLRTKGLLVVVAPLAALILIAPLLFFSQRADSRTTDLAADTLLVRSQIGDILALHLEASGELRGFLLTGSSLYLVSYQAAVDAIPDGLGRLAGLISDNPAQVARVAQLRPLTEEFLGTLDNELSTYERGNFPSAAEQQDILHEAGLLDRIGALLDKMRTEENRLLSIRKAAARNASTRTKAFVWIGVPLAVALGVMVTLLFTRGIARRIARIEQNARRLAEGERLLPMPGGGDEIGRLGTALEEVSALLHARKAAFLESEHRARQAKEEAERANRAKSEFLSRMSHELRTPLNAILGFGQLLEMETLPAEHQESVMEILKGGRHLLDLINEVLDISRIEAGGLTLSPEPVGIADALHDALDLIRPLADARSIEILMDNSVDGRHVRADRQRLKEVLLNLLSNAVKYNAEGGRVTLSCTEGDDSTMRIGVADTGPGISPAEMEHLFSPFDRLDRQEGDVEGTGLGLALSKGLMEAMGGRLDVESVPGEGSTFTVELPLAQSPLAALEPSPAETPGTRPALEGQHTLLYVEDNLSNLKLIERALERRPQVRVLSTMQGTMGIELARRHLPGLILLDLHLPDIGGEEALRRLRADPLTREIPVIILSADAMPTHVRRLLDAGAADYLTKPLDIARFLEVVDATLCGNRGQA